MFNGDWESNNLDKGMAGNVGFFLFPPRRPAASTWRCPPRHLRDRRQGQERRRRRVLPELGAHQRKARKIDVRSAAPTPAARATCRPGRRAEHGAGRDAQGVAQLGAENGAVDFTANATGGIFAAAITPEMQKLIAGQQTPEGYVKAVQAEYAEGTLPMTSALGAHADPGATTARPARPRRAGPPDNGGPARAGRLAVRPARPGDVRGVRPAAARPDASSTRSTTGTASGRPAGWAWTTTSPCSPTATC